MPGIIQCDIAIAGGGLAGSLIALALAERQPGLDVRLVEKEPHLGGNHIWSFFDSDIAAEHRWLVDPLICHHWEAYDVAFPAHRRTLDVGYNSIESERLDAVVRGRIRPERIVAAEVETILPEGEGDRALRGGGVVEHRTPNADALRQTTPPPLRGPPPLQGGSVAMLSNGNAIVARLIIDARGPADLACLDLGWQKFVGQTLRISSGHGLTRPVVMNATVPQIDGYRFVYCLPFDAETVFVEDTYYSGAPDLDAEKLRCRIAEYASQRGWRVDAIEREETGVLPVAMGGNFDAYWASGGSAAKAGMRAALFHPTTGYSLPDAVRLAARLARDPDLTAERIENHAAALWVKRRFYRLLDVMLFRATEPGQRYRILERFYRLSPALIGRFYSGRSTLADKIRILSGRPPVPIAAAVKALWKSRA